MSDIEQVADRIEQVGKGNWQVLGYGALGAGRLLGDKSTLKMCTPEGAQALSGTPASPPPHRCCNSSWGPRRAPS